MTLPQKLSKARLAQPAFEALGFKIRAQLLKKAGREMLKRREEVIALLHQEAFKIYPEILLSEAIGPLQYIKDWIGVAKPFLKPRKVAISALAFPGKKATLRMIPRGVVGIITPFNYPLGNFFKPVFAALLSGNSVMIKPSEYTPKTADWFVDIMNEFLPEGVLALHHGAGEAGAELILSGVDAVTFTGSFRTGQQVALLCAQKMIPCSFELGGKDAAVVLADCDLDRTVAGILHWAFHNAGQSCGAVDRVYVEESIADLFVERLSLAASKLEGMVSRVVPPKHPQFLDELVADALTKGAVPLADHKILDHCTHNMRIMREPTFGPVLPIMRVRDAEQALTLVNNSDYGLNASIWSRDIQKATQIAQQFQVGTSYVNNHSFTGAIPAAPWTGVKQSGYGIANSEFSLAHYTRPHTLVIDRKKSGDAWWFPLNTLAGKLGECLAKAQLGDIRAAIQIPFLIAKRQKQVLEFVRPKKTLFDFEARWGEAAMGALYVTPDLGHDFMQDLHQHMSFPGNIGMRIFLWLIGLSPIWKFKAFKTLTGLEPTKRLELLTSLYKSNLYLERQMVLLMKMNGAFHHAKTSQVLSRPPQ